jgi:hypothetical protein
MSLAISKGTLGWPPDRDVASDGLLDLSMGRLDSPPKVAHELGVLEKSGASGFHSGRPRQPLRAFESDDHRDDRHRATTTSLELRSTSPITMSSYLSMSPYCSSPAVRPRGPWAAPAAVTAERPIALFIVGFTGPGPDDLGRDPNDRWSEGRARDGQRPTGPTLEPGS